MSKTGNPPCRKCDVSVLRRCHECSYRLPGHCGTPQSISTAGLAACCSGSFCLWAPLARKVLGLHARSPPEFFTEACPCPLLPLLATRGRKICGALSQTSALCGNAGLQGAHYRHPLRNSQDPAHADVCLSNTVGPQWGRVHGRIFSRDVVLLGISNGC